MTIEVNFSSCFPTHLSFTYGNMTKQLLLLDCELPAWTLLFISLFHHHPAQSLSNRYTLNVEWMECSVYTHTLQINTYQRFEWFSKVFKKLKCICQTIKSYLHSTFYLLRKKCFIWNPSLCSSNEKTINKILENNG